jgi:hypothetical protein
MLCVSPGWPFVNVNRCCRTSSSMANPLVPIIAAQRSLTSPKVKDRETSGTPSGRSNDHVLSRGEVNRGEALYFEDYAGG